MGIFGRRVSIGLIPIHPDNAASKDWLILLEASTVVGPSPEKIRVALATQEKKIVKNYKISGRTTYFLEVKEYNPRIHFPVFCPQLYRYDRDKKLVPLTGDEIGTLIARAHEGKIKGRRSWYEPLNKLPDPLTVATPILTELDTVVVEMPDPQNFATAGSYPPRAV